MEQKEKKFNDNLSWIDEQPFKIPLKPQFEDIDDVKPPERSYVKRLTERVVVPLGLLATVSCLAMGLHSLYLGDSKRQQIFMRGRILFQGFSVVAMVIGAAVSSRSKDRTRVANNKDTTLNPKLLS